MSGMLKGKTALITGASRDLVAEIATAGGCAYVLPADVTADGSVADAIAELETQFGPLDIAVNNAGAVHMPAPFAELTLETFDRVHAAGARATFAAMHAQIRAMRGRGGAILNIVSTSGLRGSPGMGAYAATKHAIVGMTRSAALAQLTDEQRAPIAAAVPMRRIGVPHEVAEAAAWLVSDNAAFTTGAILTVDGGRLAA